MILIRINMLKNSLNIYDLDTNKVVDYYIFELYKQKQPTRRYYHIKDELNVYTNKL